MKRYRLTRNDKAKLATDPGDLAEDIAVMEYDGYTEFTDGADWHDATKKNSDGVLEVKSAATVLESGEKGRFRLWKEQHEKLVEYDREESAFYVFVLFDVSRSDVRARMKRMSPADVGHKIAGFGGWYTSGHDSKGMQFKLPYDGVFSND
jgi:hypothetical protein